MAHLQLFIMQHQQGRTFTFYLPSEGPTSIMDDESAIHGASASSTNDINLFIDHQTQSHPFQLPEQVYWQQIRYLQTELQRLRRQVFP